MQPTAGGAGLHVYGTERGTISGEGYSIVVRVAVWYNCGVVDGDKPKSGKEKTV